jgi:hypothetical protein
MTQGRNGGKSRDELAREANLVRSRLLATVEELDSRRHRVKSVRLQLERHVRQLVALGLVTLAVSTAAGILVAQRIASAAQRRRRARWHLAKGLWRHPERAMRRPSLGAAIWRALVVSIVSAAVTIPLRGAIGALLGPVPSPARPARR